PSRRRYVDPALPEWLPDVTLRGVGVGRATLDLRFWRDGARSRWDVVRHAGDIDVSERRWEPWGARSAAPGT
ncbi:MAG: hypothetical protein ACYC9X_08610, partial [Dehalococcoidia bacterium]